MQCIQYNSRNISASTNQIWKSNVDEEPIIGDIKNNNKADNMVDSEITIRIGPQDTKTRQFVTLNPDQKVNSNKHYRRACDWHLITHIELHL
jgi:hypothetical protein